MTRHQRPIVFSLILGIGLLTPLVAQQPPEQPGTVDEVVILGLNSVQLKQNADVLSGSVVANDASDGPVLGSGVELQIGQKVDLNVGGGFAVIGDDIKVRQNAEVGSDVFFNTLDNPNGTITGIEVPTASLPALVRPNFEEQAPAAGSPDIFVPQNGSATIDAGDYGVIDVNQKADVVFTGGVYNIQEWDFGQKVDVTFEAPTRIRIVDKFSLDQNSTLGPAAGSGIDASDIVFFVDGINGNSGNLGASPKAAKIGQKSVVDANFYVPNGTLHIRQNSTVTGAFIARDVLVGQKAEIHLNTAFADVVFTVPNADDQEVFTAGDQDLVITLTGSDPQGTDLTFAVDDSGLVNGTITSGPTPIVPDPVGRCSISNQSCSVDADCPGSETCDDLQAASITSATVTYDPTTGSNLADEFTFTVTDEDTETSAPATVRINPGGDPTPPPDELGEVVATPDSVETLEDQAIEITLMGTAPCEGGIPTAGDPNDDEPCDGEGNDVPLNFEIVSGPTCVEPATCDPGSLGGVTQGSEDPQRTATVTYTPAAGFTGTVSFDFEVEGDVDDSGSIDQPNETSTATVLVEVFEAQELAEDSSMTTPLNTPVLITLNVNPGGVGDGGGQAQAPVERTGALGSTFFYNARPLRKGKKTPDGSAANNGTGRLRVIGASPATRAAVSLVPDAGWSSTSAVPPAFFWTGAPPVDADDNYTFTLTGPGCLSITDDFRPGDQFEVRDAGQLILTTPSVADGPDVEVGPDAAYLDPDYSSASLDIGSGSYDLSIKIIASFASGGRGYIRVDTGVCQPNLEVTAFSAPSVAALEEEIGDQITTTVTNTGFAGIASGTSVPIGYYVSLDAAIETSDELLIGGRENLSQQAPSGLAVGESVQIDLFDGAFIGNALNEDFPASLFIGVLVDEFDAVAETDEGDNTASSAIQVDPPLATPMTWEILSLPSGGTLTTLGGGPVSVGTTFTSTPTLVFTPDSGVSGNTSFQWQITEGGVVDTALVDILVSITDDCVVVGRPVGCEPDQGQAQGGGTESVQQPEMTAADGPSDGLTIVIEGAGMVTTGSVRLPGGATLRGMSCSRQCNKRFPVGAEVPLNARPEPGYEFVRWSGACRGDGPIGTVRLSQRSQCTAVFREVVE